MNDRQHDILKRLASVRRRVRLLLAVEGAAILFLVALACGVSFALLDWWVDFPGLIRVLVLAVGCGLGAGWCWRRVVRPLAATIPLDQLALRLGIMNPEERDELAGAVSFLDGHGSGSTEIWERVVATTSQHAAGKSWGRGLNPRRSARSVGAAVVLFGGVAWTAYALPELAEIGRSRLLAPWVSVEWPRRVQIIPETRDLTAAYGESVTLAMHVSRGDDPFLRAYVEWGPAGGEMRKSLMQRESDGTFQFAIEDVRVPLEYSYSAGDDNTKRRPFHISVARRPETDSARMAIRPPPYARGASTITHELTGAPVSVVRGSHARIEVQVRHGDSTVRKGGIRFAGSNETIALIPTAGRESELTAEFEVADGGLFEIGLIDAGGLESRTRQMYELVVKDDELPAVEILSPTDDIDMTPRGVVAVSVRGRDDFGLATLLIYAGMDEGPLEPAFDLLPVEDEGREAEPAIRETQRSIQWRLGFMEPRVVPGNVIEYAAEAGDLFELDGVRHEAVRSATRRIRIVSESQFAESLRASLSAATAHLRRLASEMRTVRSDTARLNEGPLVRRSLGVREREQASRLAREMRRIAKAGKETSRQLEEIASRAAENRVSRLDVALQAKRLGRRIRAMAGESLREAGSALSRASESERFEQQGEALSKALAEEDSAIADMMEMLDSLERWNEFADMARLIRELLDRQEDLERACARLARAQGGRAIEELSSADVLPIREAKSAQQRLREETSAAIRSMGEMAKGLESTDGAAAASLDRAVEQSTRSQVLEHMATATGEIDQARLRRARESQNRAIAGLRTMLAAMDERPERELAALAKKMSDLVAQLQRLLREQEKLIDDTQAAQGQSAQSALTARLAGRQRALAGTSEAVSISGIGGDAMSAKFAIMTAVAHMGAAAALLDRGDATSSIEEQEHARVQLIEAMESLKEMLEREERDMAERSLAAIVEALASIRNNQHDLLQETSQIVDRQGSDERISRADGILLKLAARKQGELAGTLMEVMERMRGSIVFRRVCERTRERMSTAQAQMDAGEPRQAAKEQAAIVESLDRLILVLDSRPKKKGEGYVDQDAGGEGGGAGDPTKARPVPPLAELKMLRVLQLELNERTRQLNETLPMELQRSEDQLQNIAKLGEDQREIHEMSVKLIEGQTGE